MGKSFRERERERSPITSRSRITVSKSEIFLVLPGRWRCLYESCHFHGTDYRRFGRSEHGIDGGVSRFEMLPLTLTVWLWWEFCTRETSMRNNRD